MNPYIVRATPYKVQFLYYGTAYTSHLEVILSSNETLYLQGKSGADRIIHLTRTTFSHNGTDVSFYIYENPTFTADGTTQVAAINHNRQSSYTAQFTVYSDAPTPTSDGTMLVLDRIFGATGGVGQAVSAASLTEEGTEILFKKNTDYMLKVTNNVTADTTLVASWEWFESGN